MAIESEEDLVDAKPKSSAIVENARNRINEAADALAQSRPKEAGISLGENWSRFAAVFLIAVFEKMCESQPPGAFALSVAGSLSRRQATPYSDLEFFFTVAAPVDVVPFAKLADKMWDKLNRINLKTGAFSEDRFFMKGGEFNALTTTASCVYMDRWDGTSMVKNDQGLVDRLEELNFMGSVHFEMLSGARCVAGDPNLLTALKLNVRDGMSKKACLSTFRARVENDLIPAFKQNLMDLELGKSTEIDLKAAILRALLWVTVDLGRCYGQQGVGDLAHMQRLKANKVISGTVYMKMVSALNDAQAARFQVHRKNRSEHDTVALTPQLKKCLRTVSALIEMSLVWRRKQAGKATAEEMKRDCFLTSHPERYDFFKNESFAQLYRA